MKCVAHEVEYCRPCRQPRTVDEVYAEIRSTYETRSAARTVALWQELSDASAGSGLPEWVYYALGALIAHATCHIPTTPVDGTETAHILPAPGELNLAVVWDNYDVHRVEWDNQTDDADLYAIVGAAGTSAEDVPALIAEIERLRAVAEVRSEVAR